MAWWGAPKVHTEELVARLRGALGPRLRSAVLYGSAVAGDFEPRLSTRNLLLVVEPLGIWELEIIEVHSREWIGMEGRPPQVFTPEQLTASADAFAIEWLDIKQARRVLHGDDPFEQLLIPRDALRLQLEHELHAFVLGLREGYLSARGKPSRLARLMSASATPLLILMRAALRLFPDILHVPVVKLDALVMLARRLDLDLGPIASAYELHQGGTRPPRREIPALFANYLRTAELLLASIDRMLFHPAAGDERP